MDTIVRIITVVGAIITVLGLTWGLTGAYDYFGGRRSRDTTVKIKGWNLSSQEVLWQSFQVV